MVAWTERQYDDLVTGALGQSGWFPVHRALIKRLGWREALLLQYLVNLHSRLKRSKRYKWQDGWFFATVARLQDELDLTEEIQRNIVKKLVESGCLETKKMGLPAKRHFRIDAEKLVEMIVEGQSDPESSDELENESENPDDEEGVIYCISEIPGTSHPEKPGTSYPSKPGTSYPSKPGTYSKTIPSKTKSSNNHPTGGGDKRPPPNPGFALTEWHNKWAGRLRQALVEHDADLINPPAPRRGVSLKVLADVLFRIETERKVPRPQIEAVICWLRRAYGDEYTPKLRKAMDLRDRWGAIVEAKARWEGDRARAAADGYGDPAAGLDAATKTLAHRCLLDYEGRLGIGHVPQQEWIDEWLAGQGKSAGQVTKDDVYAVM